MKRILHVAVIAALFVFTGSYCFYHFGGYEGSGDGNDYAGLARNIVDGRGFALEHVYPLGLVFNSDIPQPNNMWAPGYPLYLSLWFLVCGVGDSSALYASIAALWIMILAGYIFARKVGGDNLALITAMLLGLNQIVLYAAVEGTPEILTGIFLVLTLYFLISAQKYSQLLVSGMFFGLAILTRYQIAILGIPVAILFLDNYRKNLMLWVAAVLLTVSPWLLRNLIVLGNPIYTLQAYGEFAKSMGRFSDPYYIYRSFTPMSLGHLLFNYPLDLLRKFAGGIVFLSTAFPLRFNYLGIIPFFFGLYKIWQIDGIQRKVLLMAFIGSVLIILVAAFDGHHDRHLVPLQPVFAVSTLIGAVVFARAMGFYNRRIILATLSVLLFIPPRFPYQEYDLKSIAKKSQEDRRAYMEIARLVAADEVIVADASDAVWWYANRKSIWIPVDYKDFKSLMNRPDCHYVYFTNSIAFFNNRTDDEIADFGNYFRTVYGFDGPGKLYVLYNWEPQSGI